VPVTLLAGIAAVRVAVWARHRTAARATARAARAA